MKSVSNIRRMLFSRLSIKVALLLILFGLLPLACVSILYQGQLLTGYDDAIKTYSKEIVAGHATCVEQVVEEPYSILRAHASLLSTLLASPEKQQIVLMKLSLDYSFFEHIILYDTEGAVTATSYPGVASFLETVDSSSVLQAVAEGKPFVSEMYVDRDYMPYMDIVLPYKKGSDIVGGMYAKVNVVRVWEITDSIRVGQTGRAFVSTDSGRFIAHWEKRRIFKKEVVDEMVFSQMQEHPSGYVEYVDSYGIKKAIYYTRNERRGWFVGVEQSCAELYYFRNISLVYASVAMGVISIAIGVLSITVARRVTRPIKKVVHAMREVGRGNYEVSMQPKTIDEIGRLFISFNRMNEKLKRAHDNEKLVVFGSAAANIAHKLKNSMSAIKTYVQLFQKRKEDKAFRDKMADGLAYEVHYMENILSRFSSFRKPTSAVHLPVCIRDVLHEILEIKKDGFEAKGIVCVESYSPCEGMVKCDRSDVKEVFVNIINNAVEAMPSGGELRVQLLCDECGHDSEDETRWCRVVITDNGLGIPPEKIRNIFEPFFSTKKYGMGIGLSYCQQMVHSYGGDVLVESERHVGTVVKIILPLL